MWDERRPEEKRRDSGSASVPRLSDDRFYRALASTQRRRLLWYLLTGEEITVENAATVLSGWEAADTGRMQTPDDRTQVLLELVHSDLPLLAEADLIAYDSESGLLQIEPLDPAVEQLLVESVESEPPDP
jgi:hypothetical protein